MLTVEGNAKVSVGLIHYRSTVYTGRCNFPVAGTAVSLAL